MAATHQLAGFRRRVAYVAAVATRRASPILAVQSKPTRVSIRASASRSRLKASPEARTAYTGNSTNPTTTSRPNDTHIQRQNNRRPFSWSTSSVTLAGSQTRAANATRPTRNAGAPWVAPWEIPASSSCEGSDIEGCVSWCAPCAWTAPANHTVANSAVKIDPKTVASRMSSSIGEPNYLTYAFMPTQHHEPRHG